MRVAFLGVSQFLAGHFVLYYLEQEAMEKAYWLIELKFMEAEY
jgi:hypothetical protein